MRQCLINLTCCVQYINKIISLQWKEGEVYPLLCCLWTCKMATEKVSRSRGRGHAHEFTSWLAFKRTGVSRSLKNPYFFIVINRIASPIFHTVWPLRKTFVLCCHHGLNRVVTHKLYSLQVGFLPLPKQYWAFKQQTGTNMLQPLPLQTRLVCSLRV